MYRNKKYRGIGSTSQGKTKPVAQTSSSISTTSSCADISVLHELQNIPSTSSTHEVPRKISKPNPAEEDDMFVIPASQMPSQTQRRYISQRSVLGCTQSSGAFRRLAKNYFETILIKYNVNIENSEYFILEMDHIAFVAKLRENLKFGGDSSAQEFLNGIKDAMKESPQIMKLMSGCKIILQNSDSVKISQESLMQDFLMIDFLQNELIHVLLKKIKELVTDKNSSDIHLIQLILSQFKFVDHIKNGEMIFENICEILELATSTSTKQMIINGLEDVVDMSFHDRLVRKLIELFPNNKELLTETTVCTFGNMCLCGNIQSEVRSKIINYMTNGASVTLFPTFTKFVLSFNNNELDMLPHLIDDLRTSLKWPTAANDQSVANSQKAVFDCIARSLTRSKKLFDIWLRSIVQQVEDPTKPIDFIILLIMMSINDEKRNYIENIIRRKIKADQITIKLIEEIVQNFPIILNQYSKTFVTLLDNLFQDKQTHLSTLGGTSYQLIFGIENWDRKLLLSKLVGYVCQRHDMDFTTNALISLTEINEKYPNEMQSNCHQLLRIFDRPVDLSLAQIRLIMNIICSIAYPLAPIKGNPEIQEHLDMLLRKQVSSSITSVKYRGIIGVGRIVDHIIWQTTAQRFDCEETIESIEEIPDEMAQSAAKYVELIMNSSHNCPEALALCYDELAAVMMTRNSKHKNLFINQCFLSWLCDFITNDFQNYFVTMELPKDSGADLAYNYCINSVEENSNPESEIDLISVNIGGLVLNPVSNKSRSSIIVLNSLFTLMRVVHSNRNDGDLEAINALLGCAILMPTSILPSANCMLFDEFDENKSKKMLDILFYTANWLREVISGFASQNVAMIQKKILKRLSLLIEIEDNIKLQLRTAPSDYQPPKCEFTSLHSVFKKPAAPVAAKRTSKKTAVAPTDTENASIMGTSHPLDATSGNLTGRLNTKSVKHKSSFSFSYGPKEIYRQMDPDILLILREKLSMEFPLPESLCGEYMGLLEFKFLMEDFVIKLESVHGVRKFIKDQQNQYISFPSELINDIVIFLPKIVTFFTNLTDHLQTIINETSNQDNQDNLYNTEANYTKICIGLCLRLFAALYTWPGFQIESNSKLLKDSLIALSGKDHPETSTISELSKVVINKIILHEPHVLDLRAAVHMYHVTKTLCKFSTEPDIYKEVAKLCKTFLTKTWFDYDGIIDRGAQCNILLDELLRGLFADISIKQIKPYLLWTLKECPHLKGKDDKLKTFPCIYKTNFALFYRALCVSFVSALNQRIQSSGPTVAQLKNWENYCDLVNVLLHIVQKLDIPRNFILFLRHAHIFLKVFLQHGLPVVEMCLRSYPDRTNAMLKNLQETTRYLHNLCCHSKKIKNTTIVAQIPLLRETIENLLFRVKAALAANKCATAFWMGNLKNKDLEGDEILSQTLSNETNSNADDDELLPDDEDDLDDDAAILLNNERDTSADETNHSNSSTDHSTSRIF